MPLGGAVVRSAGRHALPVRLPENTAVPNPTHITFEDRAELVGYMLPERAAAPGENLPLTLYWRALERMDEDFSVYIHLFDSNASAVGQWDAYPGGGAYPTRLWQQGEIGLGTQHVGFGRAHLAARGHLAAR